jgi:WD40 repeat protein
MLTASKGDDEMLRIWNVEAKRSHQVISDHLGRWGQITCIKWLSGNSENGNVICFGTGRGLVLVYQRTKDTVSQYTYTQEWKMLINLQDTFKELSSTTVLPFNEPVESMDYDRNECRLILSSRTGKVKAYQVEKIGRNPFFER